MGFYYDMQVFCLHAYLAKYKNMVCQGHLHKGTDSFIVADHMSHIYHSLLSFWVRTQGSSRYSVKVEISDVKKYREVCYDRLSSMTACLVSRILMEGCLLGSQDTSCKRFMHAHMHIYPEHLAT